MGADEVCFSKKTLELPLSVEKTEGGAQCARSVHRCSRNLDPSSYKPQRRTEKGSSTTQKVNPPVNGLLRWTPARKDRIWQWGGDPFPFPIFTCWCPSRKFDFYFRFVNPRIPNIPYRVDRNLALFSPASKPIDLGLGFQVHRAHI
jgi:hypothetical protein